MIDRIIKFYANLHNYEILPYWVLTPLRRFTRTSANYLLPRLLSRKKYYAKKQVDVIVSFTSFPARINNVWQVIECMFRQTYLPKKIILWLSKDQFESVEVLPESIKDFIGDIFEVRLVEGDIRSHKKYYYVSKDYPQNLIFLIDDDLYYPSDILENTYEKYMSSPGCIVGNYGYIITYNDYFHKPYAQWREVIGDYSGRDLFLGSGGGTLYNTTLMYKDFLDIEKARMLTPIADDIWFNAMADLNGTSKHIINAGLVLAIHSKNDVHLHKSNINQGGNDKQLHDIEEYYKDLKLFQKKQ